jgi:hypothetical protein
MTTNHARRQRTIGGILILASLCFSPTPALCDVDEPGSLRGLKGVMVIVERLHPDAAQIGLDRETIDAIVRDRLQGADIPILSGEERMADERRPYLYVNCNVMYLGDAAAAAFSLDIEAHQRVTLENGEKAQALTWAKSYLGVQSRDRAAAHIRHVLGGYIDQFISDYEKANDIAQPVPAQPGD